MDKQQGHLLSRNILLLSGLKSCYTFVSRSVCRSDNGPCVAFAAADACVHTYAGVRQPRTRLRIHQCNRNIYIHCSFLPERLGNFGSSNSDFLLLPRSETNFICRFCSGAAPRLCDSLPDNVKSAYTVMTFRRHLETYLFNLAYPPLPH